MKGNWTRLFAPLLFLTAFLAVSLHAIEPIRISKEEAKKLLVSETAPIYPPLAKAARIQGSAVIEVTVSEKGEVIAMRAVRGHPMLLPSAMDAVKQWKFTPLRVQDEPKAFIAEVEVVFSLNLSKEDLERDAKYQQYFPASEKARKALAEGDNATAELYARKALDAAEQAGDEKWLSIAGAKTLLAHVHMGRGNLVEAVGLYRESLKIHLAHQQPDESEVAFARSNLGRCLLEERRFDEAIPLLEDAVNTLKKRAAVTEEAQAKKGYRRTVAADSFVLAKLAELKSNHDGAVSHCKDAVENADALQESEGKTVVEECSQVR